MRPFTSIGFVPRRASDLCLSNCDPSPSGYFGIALTGSLIAGADLHLGILRLGGKVGVEGYVEGHAADIVGTARLSLGVNL